MINETVFAFLTLLFLRMLKLVFLKPYALILKVFNYK